MASRLRVPTNLMHKPVVYVDYQDVEKGDAKFISLGHASWNRRDFSIKIFRKPGRRWLRQSEEIPLQRMLDASLFLISKIFKEASSFEKEGALENEGTLNEYLSHFQSSSSIKRIFEILRKHIKDVGEI